MDLSQVDPELLDRIDRIIRGVWWGGGALVAAICLRVGGGALADIIRSLRG